MKIGIVLAKPPAYSETFFISKIKGLQKEGHQIVLLVNNNSRKFNLCQVKSTETKGFFNIVVSALKFCIRSIFKVSRLISFFKLEKKDKISVLPIVKKMFLNQHILFSDLDWLHFGFATMAIEKENLAQTIGAKMAISLRGYDIDVYPLKYINCYHKVWKNVDKIHSISNYLLEKAKDLGLKESISKQIITPAVDFKEIYFNTKASTKIQFLTIGRLHWIKNYEDILKSLKVLKDNGIDFEYKIIGDGHCLESLKYLVFELEIEPNVIFCGKLNHDKTLEELSSSDIYIQYSHSEGFCNAALEAQALGKLCVVSDSGGLPENVIDGITGFVVPKYNSNLLAQKLMEVIALPESHKKKIKKKAIERVQSEFNLKKQQQEFVSFYTNN